MASNFHFSSSVSSLGTGAAAGVLTVLLKSIAINYLPLLKILSRQDFGRVSGEKAAISGTDSSYI